ncbi:hypothetical protein SeLEV6574_g04892 [Synchytrium endobioticum]|nr:hypothetical protein SeLEV6574_g04892 [Synchytrium endobioticum]
MLRLNFPLPAIFRANHPSQFVMDHPWLLSSSPARSPRPSLWSLLRDNYFLTVGTHRIRKHLHHPSYMFPEDFVDDAEKVVMDLIPALNHATDDALASIPTRPHTEHSTLPSSVSSTSCGSSTTSATAQLADQLAPSVPSPISTLNHLSIPIDMDHPPTLEELCLAPVSRLYREAAHRLACRGERAQWKLHTKPRIRPLSTHLTYGPYPIPDGYVRQHWWDLMTLVVPQEEATFTTQQKQREILNRCIDQGTYIRVVAALDSEVEFSIWDVKNNVHLVLDKRHKILFEFSSPHFSAYDEVLELDEHGKWRLRWQWRVSDIDYLFASRSGGKKDHRDLKIAL